MSVRISPDDRSGDRSGARRVAFVSLLWTAAIAGAKLAVGTLTGSVAVLADGFHSLLDFIATGFTLAAVRIAAKPPDSEHPYGHGRAENLAALGSAGVMVLVGAGVAFEAARRLVEGTPFRAPGYALAVAGGAIVVDAWRAAVLRRAAKAYSSPALQADALNFTADIGESLAVLAGLGAARAGFDGGDSIAAFVVVAMMWVMAGRVALGAVNVLMDRRPSALTDTIAAAVRAVPGVDHVGDLRVRRSGADTHAEVTVSIGRTASVEQSHEITQAVESAVAGAVPGATTIVHVEPSHEGEDVVARTFAAANRIGMADQVHNVLAIHHPEGLWLMLHAKVPAQTALGPAHEVTLALERELRNEIDHLARVEIHLEPHEPSHLHGIVVTAQRGDITKQAARMAESHPPITRCHEVAVSEAPDGLHLVLHCEASAQTSIGEIHDASLRVESEIHRLFDDVRSVTVHFEPQGTA
ncbi:MAG TPA: cation diffusion facilitator family transporter [Actinomycetota bacterium]|jgi:cation diffusion facilitator family transporter|nr:cation diffusion facilitator family transporter [Actinomycetota bacterium]